MKDTFTKETKNILNHKPVLISCLELKEESKSILQKDISQKSGYKKQIVSKVVKDLIREGYIEEILTIFKKDLREKPLKLTKLGEAQACLCRLMMATPDYGRWSEIIDSLKKIEEDI